MRNEKDRRVESTQEQEPIEMTDEMQDAICYKSKLLNKYFDKYDDLVKEETEYKREHEAELKAKEEKKTLADKVSDAIKNRLSVEDNASEIKKEAYRNYLTECDKASEMVAEARRQESELLKEFCSKYGAFHSTIKVGDTTYKCSY